MPASRNPQNDPNRFRSKGYVATSAAEYSAHQAALAAEKRLGQIASNTSQAIGAIKAQNFADSEVKRKALAEQQAQQARAREGMQEIQKAKASGASAQQIKRLHDKYTISEQTLKQQRQSRSHAASVIASRKSNNPAPSQSWRTIFGDGYKGSDPSNPIKGEQPNYDLVSPYLKAAQNPKGSAYNPYEGRQPDQSLISPFLKPKTKDNPAPSGTLASIYGEQDKVSLEFKKDGNFLENLGIGLYNSLRYSDAVDRNEVPKPEGINILNDLASRGLRPFYNIVLGLSGQKTSPTLAETAFDTGADLALTGKTKVHDPIGDYIRKNPLGALVQLPAEAALWVTSSKAIGAAGTALKKYSPLQYQAKKIITNENKAETLIRSVTVNNKPVMSLQNGKLVKGYDPLKVPFEKINASTREGFEASVGSGIEKTIFYSDTSLKTQVSRGIIDETSAKRASAFVKAVEQSRGITNKGQPLGKEPFEGLTQPQAKHILDLVSKGQKSGEIDLIHGSVATKASSPPAIQTQAGSALKLGDIDITPKGKNLTKTADKLIQGFANDFPLSPGQRIRVKGLGAGDNVNRAIEISGGNFKEPEKILEVVLRTSEQSKSGLEKGTKILGFNIPFKQSVKVADYPIKTHVADYQLLTNVKQALAYQKGKDAMFQIYTSSGRTKDIVRAYWNLKSKGLFKGGASGLAIDKQAEKIRSLYPKLDFTDYNPEPVLLYSSKVQAKSSSGLAKGFGQTSLKMDTSKSSSDSLKIPERDDSIFSTKNVASRKPKYEPAQSSRVLDSNSIRRPVLIDSSYVISQRPRPRSTYDSIRQSMRQRTSNKNPSYSSKNSAKNPSNFSSNANPLLGTPSSIPKSESVFNSLVPRGDALSRNARLNVAKKISRPYDRKFLPIIIPKFKNKTDRQKPKRYESHNFLGNTNVADILGFRTKKKDVDVGDRKTSRLYDENISLTSRKKKGLFSKGLGLLGGKKSKKKFRL